MKAVVLAGGVGTRLSEETGIRPKPMVEIGEQPILWHILKIYSTYGVNDFIICCGYKSHIIKQYFRDYMLRTSSTTFDMRTGDVVYHDRTVEPWRITLVETGTDSMTGGRLKRVRDYIGDETFFMTYGDGVSDVDIAAEFAFHRAHGKLATMTAVQPPGRFGVFGNGDVGLVGPDVRPFVAVRDPAMPDRELGHRGGQKTDRLVQIPDCHVGMLDIRGHVVTPEKVVEMLEPMLRALELNPNPS